MGAFPPLSLLSCCNPRRLAASSSQVCKEGYRVLWGFTLEYNLNWKLSRHLENGSYTFYFSVEIGEAGKWVFVYTEGQNII